MASKTATATTAPAEPVADILDVFEERLVTVEGISTVTDLVAKLSKVIFGEVIGGMYDAADEELAPVKDDAPAAEKSARKRLIENRIVAYIAAKTGRYYSVANLMAWKKAGAVNVLLPERIRVTMTPDPSGDPRLAKLDGVFSVWALTYLGQIEDVDVRAATAEELYDAGTTSEQDAKTAADKVNNKAPKTEEPVAAAAMATAMLTGLSKTEAAALAKLQHILLTTDPNNVLEVLDIGRILWSRTKSDPNEKDVDERKRKRLQVFRDVAEQLTFGATPADEDDGAIQKGINQPVQ